MARLSLERNLSKLSPNFERRQNEACGRPLTTVFHIVNENTRERVADPIVRCLTEDTVVGSAV